METILALYAGISMLLILASLPLIAKKVKPNSWYGFRAPQTLANPDVWYAVNAHAGIRLLATGVITMAAALGLAYVPGLDVDSYAWACLAVFAVTFGLGMVQSWRYMRSLTK